MKYAGRTVPKPKYRLGTRVHIATRKGSPTGRITKDTYEGKGYGWSYKVKMDEGGKRYYVLETGMLYRDAKAMVAEWKRRRSFNRGDKRLATIREYASGTAVYVRPKP